MLKPACIVSLLFLFINQLHSQSDSVAYFLNKGLESRQRGRTMEALTFFQKAKSFNSQNVTVQQNIAASYSVLHRYPQAYEAYQQLESMGDHSDTTLMQLMVLSLNMRQFDNVIKYALLYQKQNQSAKLSYYLAKAYYQKENLGEAIKYFEVAAKEDPANSEIPYTVARAYSDMEQYSKAIPYFQKAVSLNPVQSRWIYEMALTYYAIHDDNNSLKYMLQAGEKGYRQDNEYLQNLATAYVNVGKLDEGVSVLTDLLAKRPADKGIIGILAQTLYDAKKYDQAISYYDKLLEMDKKNAEVLYMIGMCFQKKGDKEKGVVLCDRAIQMDPSLQNLKQKKQLPQDF